MLVSLLAVLAAGGLLLHTRAHPLDDPANIVTLISGLLSVFVIPWLFLSRRTIHLGYIVNGMTVIIGTITMVHFSMANPPPKLDAAGILFHTTLADILLLWGKFFAGRALFLVEFYSPDAPYKPGLRTFRYPHTGWWLAHLSLMSAVYWLGHLLWR